MGKTRVEKYSMILGSNLFKDVEGVITYEDEKGRAKDLFILEKSGTDLLLTIEIKDEHGDTIAKLNRNSFVYTKGGIDGRRRFETKRSPNQFTLIDSETSSQLFKATITESGVVVVIGIFYIGNKKIEALEDKLVIDNRMTLSGNTIIGSRTGIKLFENGGIGIG